MYFNAANLKFAQICVVVAVGLAQSACTHMPATPLSSLKFPDIATTGSVQKTNSNKSFYFEPVTGAPDKVSKQFRQALIKEAKANKLTVASKPTDALYRVHSYLLTNMNGKTNSLNYIIDVNDKLGYRAKRVSGDLKLKRTSKKQFWSSVTPAMSQEVAKKTAKSLTSWKPKPRRKSASTTTKAPTKLAKAVPSKPKKTQTAAQTANDRLTTSALSSRNFARITPIRNAPGDGRIALANAIRSELNKNGIKTIASSSIKAYVVGGDVKISKPDNGLQTIQITWDVKDAQGQSIGSVHQSNSVPAGALDQRWGETAKAAASAASTGIVKLIKKSNKKTQ